MHFFLVKRNSRWIRPFQPFSMGCLGSSPDPKTERIRPSESGPRSWGPFFEGMVPFLQEGLLTSAGGGGGCTTLVGWFLGWKYDPQLYGDYFIGQDKDAVINQSVFSWLMSAKGFETKFGLLATQNILSETSPPLTKYTNSRTCGIPSSPKQFTIAIQTAKQQPFDFFSD